MLSTQYACMYCILLSGRRPDVSVGDWTEESWAVRYLPRKPEVTVSGPEVMFSP